MDGPCTYEELRDCLRSITRVNQMTRAYYPTLRWLDHLYGVLPRQAHPVHIVDVGCGYGDMLRRIALWAEDRKLPVKLTGIDLNANAIRAAREATLPGTVTFLAGNAYDFKPPEGIDVVISSLMTHHMEDAEIVTFLGWMEASARLGWFINDLHRERIPYYFYRTFAPLTTLHRFAKHDGAVSILRSFQPAEWRTLLQAAAIPPDAYLLQRYRPARLCVARVR